MQLGHFEYSKKPKASFLYTVAVSESQSAGWLSFAALDLLALFWFLYCVLNLSYDPWQKPEPENQGARYLIVPKAFDQFGLAVD